MKLSSWLATRIFAAVAILSFYPIAGSAAIIEIVPSALNAEEGETVSVDIIIGGLNAAGPDSLGAYDLDILYDNAVLNVVSITPDNAWGGGPAFVFDLGFGDLGGRVDLAAFSFASSALLDSVQGASGRIATVIFSVSSVATPVFTSIELDLTDPFLFVGDAFGAGLPLDAIRNASLDIFPRTTSTLVTEPPTLALLILVAACFVAIRDISRRRNAEHRFHCLS